MYDCIDKAYLEVVTQGSRSTYSAISKLTKNFSYTQDLAKVLGYIFKNL